MNLADRFSDPVSADAEEVIGAPTTAISGTGATARTLGVLGDVHDGGTVSKASYRRRTFSPNSSCVQTRIVSMSCSACRDSR